MNNKGNVFTDVLMALIIIAFLAISVSVVSSLFGIQKGADVLNCKGYIDPYATAGNNQSYNSARNSDTITCSIVNFGPAFWVLSVFFIVIAKLMAGGLMNEPQQQQYAPY